MYPKIYFERINPSAEQPKKENLDDITEKISVVSRTDNRAEDDYGKINSFGTGLVINPQEGFYVEIIPSKDLGRYGYLMTANQIISFGNDQELIVDFYKFLDQDDLELPFQALEMIVKKEEKHFVSDSGSKSRPSQSQNYGSYGVSQNRSQNRSQMMPLGGSNTGTVFM